MPKQAPVPLEDQLCFSLYRANLEIGRAYQPLFDTLGITYPQFLVLHTLWEKDGRPVGQIADRLALESSNITPLIKRLEAAGLLTRRRNPDDDRQVLVTLTPRGRALEKRCTLALFTPKPDASLQNYALSLDKADAPPEDMDLGQQFAQKVTLECH